MLKKLETKIVKSLSNIPLHLRLDAFEDVLDMHNVPEDVDIDLDTIMERAQFYTIDQDTEKTLIKKQQKLYNKILKEAEAISYSSNDPDQILVSDEDANCHLRREENNRLLRSVDGIIDR